MQALPVTMVTVKASCNDAGSSNASKHQFLPEGDQSSIFIAMRRRAGQFYDSLKMGYEDMMNPMMKMVGMSQKSSLEEYDRTTVRSMRFSQQSGLKYLRFFFRSWANIHYNYVADLPESCLIVFNFY